LVALNIRVLPSPSIRYDISKNSLVLLAGNLGAGKTIFSAQLLHCGATEYSENSI
jgi:KaiC/GvpD/RAD55 family RecA-like ATPase